jgi:hypothetical protein
LSVLSRGKFFLDEHRDGTIIQKRRGLFGLSGLDVAKRPAKQPCVELLGGGKIRGDQLGKDYLAYVVLSAGRGEQRRQRRCSGDAQRSPGDAKQ